MSPFVKTTHSPEETLALGQCIGAVLTDALTITLDGDLGAGKTWLAKGIAFGAGVPDYEYVNSPAYDLIHEYQGRLKLYHLDLYRLERLEPDDVEMLREIYPQGVCLIEWASRLKMYPRLYPRDYLAVNIAPMAEHAPNSRTIQAEAHGNLPADFVVHIRETFT